MNGLAAATYQSLLDARVTEPESFVSSLRNRARRPLLMTDRRLLIVAADHTARGILAAGDDPFAIANRRSLLDRLVRALAHDRVDGVLASADILEELAWLGSLESKLAFGTMNRGGYLGSSWGLDDRFTAYDAAHIAKNGLDGGKVLLRIEHTDIGVLQTLESIVREMRILAEHNLVCIVEPLPYRKDTSGLPTLDKSTDRIEKVISIAAGLTCTSMHTWLKLPAWTNRDTLAKASTLPILLLGGDPGEDIDATFAEWETALAIPNVIGLVAGRPLLFPHQRTVEESVERAALIVHGAAR